MKGSHMAAQVLQLSFYCQQYQFSESFYSFAHWLINPKTEGCISFGFGLCLLGVVYFAYGRSNDFHPIQIQR